MMKLLGIVALATIAVSVVDAAFVGTNRRPLFGSPATRATAAVTARPASSLRMAADDEQKVIFITGASQGLGKSIALECAKFGHKIVVNYLDEANKPLGLETIEEVKAAGGDAIGVMGDASKIEEVEAMFKEAAEQCGKIDVLVNNAGITRDGLVMRMKPAQWQAVINVNLSGVFYCSQAFFKIASKQRYGRIINMSSVVGKIGNPGQANYAAAKAGVIGLTLSNAKEFATRNVTVNAVCPGYIATDMTAKLDPEYLKKVCELIPAGRLGTADEVAGMVRFLALDKSCDYVTGQTFNVDGGIGMGT